MPLYTYKCNKCEDIFEARQKFSDEPLTDCPTCEGGTVRRLINQVGVVFKGSGFYVNDTKSNNPAGPSTNGKSESGEGESSSGGEEKSASKPEAKKETSKASSSSSGDA
ncbi:MAG: zinc ribbon domain-containing protein [Chloroflexota bacterium]